MYQSRTHWAIQSQRSALERKCVSLAKPDTRDAALNMAYDLIDRGHQILRIAGPLGELSGEEVHRLYDAQDRWILTYRRSWPGSQIKTLRFRTRHDASSAACRRVKDGGWQTLEITGPGEPISGVEIHESNWRNTGGQITFGA
jgi:hypothetical protein